MSLSKPYRWFPSRATAAPKDAKIDRAEARLQRTAKRTASSASDRGILRAGQQVRIVFRAVALLVAISAEFGRVPLATADDAAKTATQPESVDRDSASPVWLRGDALDARLTQPFAITGPPRPLRTLLQRVAEVNPIAFWIDPRIDPQVLVDPNRTSSVRSRSDRLPSDRSRSDRSPDAGTETLRTVLDRVANSIGGQVARWGDTIAIVPDDRIRSLAAQLDADRNRRRGPFATATVRDRDLVWDELRTPGRLLADVAAAWPDLFAELPSVRHDVWRDGAWLSVPDTLAAAAILVPMGVGVEWDDDGALRAAPLQDRYEYPVNYPTGRRTVERLRPLFPERQPLRIRPFVGTATEHETIRRALAAKPDRAAAAHVASEGGNRPESPDATDRSKAVYTLRLEAAPLGAVLRTLQAKDIPIAFTAKSLAAADLSKRIDLDVTNVTAAELGRAIADAAGLEVVPADADPNAGLNAESDATSDADNR